MSRRSGEGAAGTSIGISIKDNGVQYQSRGATIEICFQILCWTQSNLQTGGKKGTVEEMTWPIHIPQNIYEKCSITCDGVVYKLLCDYPDGLNSVTLLFLFKCIAFFYSIYFYANLCQIQIHELDIN